MADNALTEDDDDLIVVETDTIPAQDPEPEPEAEKPAAEDPEEDDEEDDEDERLADDADEDPDGDTSVSANRKKRAKRRQIQKMAKEAAQRELQALRAQNEAMAKRLAAVEGNALSQNEMAIDARMTEAQREIQQAEMIIARAIEAGNGEDVTLALKMRDEAAARVNMLDQVKRQIAQAKNQPTPADPAAVSLAQEWMSANPWYDPRGGNEDSAITNAIDARLVAEGYNPTSVEYWQELTRRVRTRLSGAPRKAERNDARDESNERETTRKKAPPMGTTREHAPPSTKKEVYVTPERKQAMIDAGIWDDPVRRNQMLKAYQAYDRNSAR
jgi:hypothetical protein